ncbi:MAG: type 4a pilus biogenesis protein PilO, partial [Nitrospinaceae bacterium]|nr:type 4a pilus biogenesis protein PilO [Nitrospinaceae bacterium]NIR54959.1 type 4a pilus biogenesis protein PilO [Nitrospinaceae bacterium]NIS85372.1 type 4a pilus biogenesis protein PilO [Nitrospinaceae bacterium]NIT82199.1 type 4a pilus biogenesis protein PilO [Nitrospinaceae bacterium]NIU44443.1 type 4a pilus biogenesis protein PilO [Nitrospinaceae bacterium]
VILADNIKTYQEAFRLIHSQKIGEKIEQRDQEIAALQSDINTIKARMAEKVVDIVRELRRQAEHQGAKMLSLNTRERAVASQDISYKEVTLFLTFESNYQAIKNFVMELYQIPAILAVRDMQMKRTRENYPAIVTSMTIKLYVK